MHQLREQMARKGQMGSLDKTQNAGGNETEDKEKTILVQHRQGLSRKATF